MNALIRLNAKPSKHTTSLQCYCSITTLYQHCNNVDATCVCWEKNLFLILELNFSFRYIRLCDIDIPRENWQNYWQTVETLINSGSVLFANNPFGGLQTLNFSTCSSNSADDKSMIFFLGFPRKEVLIFHANCLQFA